MTAMLSSEYDEQVAVVDYLRLKYPNVTFFASANGGLRNKIVAAKLKKAGVCPGVPDLFIARGRSIPAGKEYFLGLFIEMKISNGSISPAQRIMMGKLTRAGYRCEVCYGADEAMKVLDEYLS
jgi:hypothetical protein